MMKTVLTITVMAALMIGGVAQAALDMPLLHDTYVDAGAPTTSYASLNTLRIQGAGTDFSDPLNPLTYSVQQLFVQFDVSAVPADAELTFAEFGIYLNDQSGTPKPSMQLWDLNTNTWDDTLTWNSSRIMLGDKTDIGISQSTDSAGRYYVWSWSDLNTWNYANELVAGKASFMLTADIEDSFNFAQFNSGQNADFQPYLKLAYLPEPTTMILLIMGMVRMAAFRKK
jgi:hypothetical protein